jgi:hypothetical protein
VLQGHRDSTHVTLACVSGQTQLRKQNEAGTCLRRSPNPEHMIAQIFIRVTGTVSIADDDTHAQPSFTICVQRTGSGTFVLIIQSILTLQNFAIRF